jgi:hypothetical protein
MKANIDELQRALDPRARGVETVLADMVCLEVFVILLISLFQAYAHLFPAGFLTAKRESKDDPLTQQDKVFNRLICHVRGS